MKYSPNILVVPFILWALILAYLAWKVNLNYAPAILVPMLFIIAFLVWRSPISLWWYRRYPPELDTPVVNMLQRTNSYYQSLDDVSRQQFDRLVVMYAISKEFQPMGFETVANDIKAAVGVYAAMLGVAKWDDLSDGVEQIILYRHPFQSPNHVPFHTGEFHAEDGALIFSTPHLMGGFLQPKAYYDVGLHVYAAVYRHRFPNLHYPVVGEEVKKLTENITRMKYSDILETVGLPDDDWFRWSVSVVLYFRFQKALQKHWPDMFESLTHLFQPIEAVGGQVSN